MKNFGTQMKSISFARSFPRTFLVSMNENGKKWMNKKKEKFLIQKLEGSKMSKVLSWSFHFHSKFPEFVNLLILMKVESTSGETYQLPVKVKSQKKSSSMYNFNG